MATIVAFKNGLPSMSSLYRSLTKKTLATLEGLFSKVGSYADLEEDMRISTLMSIALTIVREEWRLVGRIGKDQEHKDGLINQRAGASRK